MYAHSQRELAQNSRLASLFAGIATIAAGVCILAGDAGVRGLRERASLRLDLGSIAWWGGVDYRLAQPDGVTQPVAPIFPALVSAAPDAATPRTAVAQAPRRKKKVIQDSISRKVAAPVILGSASETEISKVRSLHGMLRRQFYVALNTQGGSSPLNTHLAQIGSQGPGASGNGPGNSAPPSTLVTLNEENKDKAPVKVAEPARAPAQVASIPQELAQEVRLEAPTAVVVPADPAKIHEAASDLAANRVIPQADMTVPEVDYQGIEQVLQSIAQDTARQILAQGTPEKVAAPAGSGNSQSPAKDLLQPSLGKVSIQTKAMNTQKANVVELISGAIVRGATDYLYSFEGYSAKAKAKQGEGGWKVTAAKDHWSTLSWGGLKNTRILPLISASTAADLAKRSSVSLMADAGIIFGKLPSGMTVELSGRAEPPVYFPTKANDGSRYFAMMNAAPGAHLLYFASTADAVAVPVLEGVATYLDLTQAAKKTVRGRVLRAESADASGMTAVSVSVVGQPRSSAITDASGNFELKNVVFHDGMPIQIETRAHGEHVHRYRLMASSADLDESQAFYRFSPSQVDQLIGQLEEGVSSDSGLAIAAVPGLTAASTGRQAFAQVYTVAKGETFDPETYALDSRGRLRVSEPLIEGAPRFIAVQIPSGLAMARVSDEAKKAYWSQMVVASPKVINVLGPNP